MTMKREFSANLFTLNAHQICRIATAGVEI
jgi:hypothetical protein